MVGLVMALLMAALCLRVHANVQSHRAKYNASSILNHLRRCVWVVPLKDTKTIYKHLTSRGTMLHLLAIVRTLQG